MTVISVVVPAHDEEAVIGACLGSMLRDAEPNELEIVVVANACTDRTAAIAGAVPGVHVVETPIGSKSNALNLGDAVATAFPRLYVDADVELDIHAVRAVASALGEGTGALLAGPRLVHELVGRPWLVKCFYRAWGRRPYATDAHVGSGVYAVSEEGRARFDRFPELNCDDLWIRDLFAPSERRTVEEHTFVQHPPLDLRSLIAIRARMHAANMVYRRRYANLAARGAHRSTDRGRVGSLSEAVDLAVFSAIQLIARVKGRRKVRRGDAASWERDASAREVRDERAARQVRA
jgi:glycosyltransferase involved in cell wall biosynthesis